MQPHHQDVVDEQATHDLDGYLRARPEVGRRKHLAHAASTDQRIDTEFVAQDAGLCRGKTRPWRGWSRTGSEGCSRVSGGGGWIARSTEHGEEPLDLLALGNDGANGEVSTATTTDAKGFPTASSWPDGCVGKRDADRGRAVATATARRVAIGDRRPVIAGSEREKVGLFAFSFVTLSEPAPVSVNRDGERAGEVDDVDGRAEVEGLISTGALVGEVRILRSEREDRDVRGDLEDGERGELRLDAEGLRREGVGMCAASVHLREGGLDVVDGRGLR